MCRSVVSFKGGTGARSQRAAAALVNVCIFGPCGAAPASDDPPPEVALHHLFGSQISAMFRSSRSRLFSAWTFSV